MKLRRIFKRIIFPPLPFLLVCTVVSACGLVYAFIGGGEGVPVYLIYALSFYTLCALTAFSIFVAPPMVRRIKRLIFDTKYGSRYKNDINFRTRTTLYLSLLLNFGNVLLNILYGAVYGTRWFFILAFYYATLALMRFMVSIYSRKNELGDDIVAEWKRARACAFVMLLINLSLSGVVLMMMYEDRGFAYEGILIYVMAAYSFYHITTAIVNLIRYRKYKSPILGTVKAISLTAALISMLSLETAMFASFGGDMTLTDKRIFIAATGAGICVIVVSISLYTIIHSTKALKRIGSTRNEG